MEYICIKMNDRYLFKAKRVDDRGAVDYAKEHRGF